MSKLIDLNLKTNGILLMSDDVLLKHWNLNDLNSDSYWYIKNPNCKLDFKSKNSWPWDVKSWFATENGEKCIIKTFDSIKKIVKNDIINKKVFEKFIQMYKNNLNETSNDIDKILSKICKDGSDIFYLPKKLFHDFNIISKLFGANNVFLEFAVPIILTGIDKFNEHLQGYYFWQTQTDIKTYYNQIKHFSHPVKLSQYNTNEMRRFICQYFIIDKFNHL